MSRLGIVIGDVSGKGAPAAIYAALVSRHEEQKNCDRKVLECGHLRGGKTGVVPKLNLAWTGLRFEMVFDRREAHNSAEADFRLAERGKSVNWVST